MQWDGPFESFTFSNLIPEISVCSFSIKRYDDLLYLQFSLVNALFSNTAIFHV